MFLWFVCSYCVCVCVCARACPRVCTIEGVTVFQNKYIVSVSTVQLRDNSKHNDKTISIDSARLIWLRLSIHSSQLKLEANQTAPDAEVWGDINVTVSSPARQPRQRWCGSWQHRVFRPLVPIFRLV